MTAIDFASAVIEGPGGMNDYEDHEMVVWHNSDRVAAAHWMLKCLANPDCKGSEEAVAAILEARSRKIREKLIRLTDTPNHAPA